MKNLRPFFVIGFLFLGLLTPLNTEAETETAADPPVKVQLSKFKNTPCGVNGPSAPFPSLKTDQKCGAWDLNFMIREDLKSSPDYKPTKLTFLTSTKGFSVLFKASEFVTSVPMQGYIKRSETGTCSNGYCLTYFTTQVVYPSGQKIIGFTFLTPKGKFTYKF